MITVDASVIIAVLAEGDVHHLAARAIVASEGRLSIHTMTLAEVLVGGVRIGREQPMTARIGQLGVVELPRHDDEAAKLARLGAGTGLKLPECCVIFTAETNGSPLATFDERLARVARDRGIEVLGA